MLQGNDRDRDREITIKLRDVLDWLLRILAIMILPITFWAVNLHIRMAELEGRIEVIEGNRFTSGDAVQLQMEIMRRPTREELPYSWFQDRVAKLEADVEKLREANDKRR